MIKRELYMEKIRGFIDKPIIKVLTGVRRCGKSMLLQLLRDELIGRGVPEEQIIYLNFESLQNADIQTYMDLYQAIKGKVSGAGWLTFCWMNCKTWTAGSGL